MMTRLAAMVILVSVGCLLSGCVSPSALPVASFTQSSEIGPSPLLVTFNASASFSTSGALVGYAWDFGDGNQGSGMIVTHAYQVTQEQTFTITLHVTDHEGQTASAFHTVTVQASVAKPDGPSIEFVWPFHYDADGDDSVNLNDEYFTLQNTGNGVADLSNWTVENDQGVAFRFPLGFSLAPGATVTIHSGSGMNSSERLYWSADAPVWDANDLAFLLNAAGEIVTHYVIVSC